MSHADRILMGPGPGNPYPQVIKAFGRPVLGPLDPDFIALLDETTARLRAVFRTTHPLTFPPPATTATLRTPAGTPPRRRVT